MRCGGPIGGWYYPVGNQGVAVYVGLVIGLGFAFTEMLNTGAIYM